MLDTLKLIEIQQTIQNLNIYYYNSNELLILKYQNKNMNAQQFRKLIKEEISNILSEAAVPAIDAKKMTAIAKLISDKKLFPELDGESLNPDSSMNSMKDTIDVIVKLGTVINDNKKAAKFINKMTEKHGSDQVIWMNAENADQIEDPDLNEVFTALDEAIDDLRYCFADFEYVDEFQKSYTQLARAIDKVLAAMGKNKPAAGAGKSASKSGMWLAEKDIDTEVNTAKKDIVAWAKSNGITGTQLKTLDQYILDLCQAYAQNQ
jgi:hypothetical protein